MTINQRQDELIARFSKMESWLEKYTCIIQMGKELPAMDAAYRKDANLIWSCQAMVWVHSEEKDGRLFITADSDAFITKGLIALVLYVLSGHRIREIADSSLYFMDKINLKEHLTPNKSNGILAMINGIQTLASEGRLVAASCTI
ncbi:SufE family protein [Pedobacter sp. FW305-3-2-15-E-R2A2]|jgi:cysteine desulfuration protein SufE|uniref:SufE family protein n=1 Tax=Pedobacter sp. FW305-3-2-15-E-R2A2 TaxID=3140251 RepID=UPI003140C010